MLYVHIVSDGEDFSGGLPIPIIAGTAGGVLAVLLCVGVICVKWLRRRKACCLNAVVDSAQGLWDSPMTS